MADNAKQATSSKRTRDRVARYMSAFGKELARLMEARGLGVREVARRVPCNPVPPEYSIERLTCAIASRIDAVMVGLPGAAQDRLPASSPATQSRCPGVPRGPGEGC
jgi:hypothetical protein